MWYYTKNGIQVGAVSTEELSVKVKDGEVVATDLIWREGMADWLPLSQVSEFEVTGVVSVPPPIRKIPVPVPVPQPAAYPVGYVQGRVPNYLWQSIVVTVLCCLPFGVVSIIYAAKVDSLVAQGDIVRANAASTSAKNWAIAGAVTWFVVVVAYIGLMILIGAGAAVTGS